MATFTGQLISATYDAIIKTIDNDAIGGTAKQLTDGLGNVTPLYVSTTQIGIGITPTEALHVSGNIKASSSVIATTFSGDLNGTINTATTGVTQTAGDNTTKIATTAFVQESHTGKPTGSGTGGKIALWSGSGTSTVLTDSSITEESTQYLLTKDIRIFDPIPVITLQDSDSSGSASSGDIQWLDNAASQRAIISLSNAVLGITSKHGGLNFGTNSTPALTIDGSQNAAFTEKVTSDSTITTDGGTTLTTKDYVDSIITAQGLNFSGTSGTGSVDLDSQTFAVIGTANEIETSAGSQQLQIGLPTNVTIGGAMTVGDDVIVSGNITLVDKTTSEVGSILLGGGNDLQIFHDGSNSFVSDSGTGDLILRSNSTAIIKSDTTKIQAFGSSTDFVTINSTSATFAGNVDIIKTTSDVAGELRIGGILASDNLPFGKINFANTAAANSQTNDVLAYIAGEKTGSSNRGELTFATSNDSAPVERLRIDSSGNSTFEGQVNVADTLKIGGATSGTKTLIFESTTNAQNYNIDFYSNSSAVQGRINYAEGPGSINLLPNSGATAALSLAYGGDATFAGLVNAQSYKASNFVEVQVDDAEVYWTNTANTDYWVWKRDASANFRLAHFNGTTTDDVLTFSSSNNSTFAGNVKIGSSTTGTPAANASDLVIDKGASESGITLISTAASSLRFGDAANTSIGSIEYNHNSDYMRMIVNNAERMRITSGGNINLGTGSLTQVSYQLRVDSDFDNGIYMSAGSSSSNYAMYIEKSTGGSSIFNVRGDGNVGIGTDSPDAKLEVEGNINSGFYSVFAKNTNAGSSAFVSKKWLNDDAAFGEIWRNSSTRSSGGQQALSFNMYNSNDINFWSGASHTMALVGNNVGIGTDSPDLTGFGWNCLSVVGGTTAGDAGVLELGSPTTNANAQNLGIIAFMDGTTRNAQIDVQRATSTSTSNMSFYTNGGSGIEERMRITSGGDIQIPTDSAKIQLRSSGSADYTSINRDSSNTLVVRNTAGNSIFALENGGNLVIGGTLTQGSDISYKENIKPLESQLEIVNKLNPVSYNRIGQKENEIGFIAQEVEKLIPDLVSENPDGLKSLAYGNMTSILVKSIQEQQDMIQELKKEIEILKNK